MKYRHVLSRRTFLRGAGTVAIALPFLDEMLTDSVFAADPAPPTRVLTFFFGLGVPRAHQHIGAATPFRDHLGPLAEVADKVCFPRGIYYEKGSRTSGNHARGSLAAFVGERDAGASIDQKAFAALHGATSPTAIRSLVAGTFTRQDGNSRHVHSWVAPRVPTAQPVESPRQLFDQVFGSFMPPATSGGVDPVEAKRARYERSVLDTAMEQYRYAKSDAFGLGATSRAKLELHLERIREIERRIHDPSMDDDLPPAAAGCPPARPGDFTHPEMVEIQKRVNNEGVRMDVGRWMQLWHAMVDVYAMAVKCDVSRFGNLQFQSGGERVVLYGEHEAYGQRRSFDDRETTHEYWHGWAPGNADERLMLDHVWLLMAELTYFLKALDDPDYRDANGGTVLDNALVLAGTELGDGRRHDVEHVFHLVAGANGAIRNGAVLDVDASATELYNAGLRAVGIDDVSMDGDPDHDGAVLEDVLT